MSDNRRVYRTIREASGNQKFFGKNHLMGIRSVQDEFTA